MGDRVWETAYAWGQFSPQTDISGAQGTPPHPHTQTAYRLASATPFLLLPILSFRSPISPALARFFFHTTIF